MNKLISQFLWGIIGICHFILAILWHYKWYCGPQVKKINPSLYAFSRNTGFATVVKNAWYSRNNEP